VSLLTNSRKETVMKKLMALLLGLMFAATIVGCPTGTTGDDDDSASTSDDDDSAA
jgi:hypothetical protein